MADAATILQQGSIVPPPAAHEDVLGMAPVSPAEAPSHAPVLNASPSPAVPHTQTESSLAPTSEYMRYLLAAWGARYVFRGFFGTLFDKSTTEEKNGLGPLATKIMHTIEKPGKWLMEKFPHSSAESKTALAYNTALGVGSMALTTSYSWMVYKDIKHIFCEAVGEELGKPADQVTFGDIRHSDNIIVKNTVKNFWEKLAGRLAVDLSFFPAAWLRSDKMGDLVLGAKAMQLFVDTWKRKPTMFEDMVTFVNNKINPRNGLGQPISNGEVFDLYQHYADRFHPQQMFRNVLENGSNEGVVWQQNQQVFARIAELMNQTYAYKHVAVIDPQTGQAVPQANFALPKFIYLLGHDLIDPQQPQRTLAFIEVMNAQGVTGIKQAKALLAEGVPATEILTRLGISQPVAPVGEVKANEQNAVLHKGSTMQLDSLPVTTINKDGLSIAQLATHAAQVAV